MIFDVSMKQFHVVLGQKRTEASAKLLVIDWSFRGCATVSLGK